MPNRDAQHVLHCGPYATCFFLIFAWVEIPGPILPEYLMSGVRAVVLIKAETSLVNELAQQLVQLHGVAEVFSVAGRYDLVALVRVRENEDLAEVISHQIRKLEGVIGTETLIAFRVYTKEQLAGVVNVD